MRLVLRWLVLCGLATTTVGAQAPWPAEGPPRPLSARNVAFPAYELRTLPNGLQVVVVLHHAQPAVSLRMLVRAGSALDPKEKLGLAHLTASLLDQGTTSKSASELNDAIDFIGAEEDTGASTDLSYVNLIVMKDSFEVGLGMLSDMVRHPAFAQAELDRQRQQLLSNLEVSFQDPEFLANSVFDRLVYGFHPYGLPDTGTPATIGAITRDDLVAFHGRNYVPNNAILAVVGDVTADEAFASANRVFGDWIRRDVPKPTFTAPPQPARRVIIVNKPDAVQTEVRVGQLGVRRNHPDYMAVNLAIRILGGEGANRLHQVLRTERSLTYGAEANMDTLLESGDFEAETNTRSEATGEVLRLIVDEFWRLQRERVGERELSDAQAYITGSFPLTIETPDAIATQVLNVLFFGLPVAELQTYRDRVNAVTPDDVQRVAREYLKPDRLSIVLVGNAAAFQSQLKGLGFGTFETINVEDLDLTSANFRRPPRRAAAPAQPGGASARGEGRAWLTPERRLTAAYAPQDPSRSGLASPGVGDRSRLLLDRVLEAKGGFETLRHVASIVAVTQTETSAPRGSVETVTQLEYPNRVRVETALPEGAVVQAFDGTRGWVKDPKGVHDLPEPMIRDLQAGFRRDTIGLLLAAHDGKLVARSLPDRKDATGRPHQALEISGLQLDPMVLLVDPQTGLIDEQTFVLPGPPRSVIEELFSDYRTVGGVRWAFTAQVRQDGHPLLERHVVRLSINEPLDSALFKRPSA